MTTTGHPATNEWATEAHAGAYLHRGPGFPPHRDEGEAVLLALLPPVVRLVVDLGCGDGRLLATVLAAHPEATGIAVDGSPPMLAAARARFGPSVEVVAHDLDQPLPDRWPGQADAVVSAFAIHHCTHERKRALYAEVAQVLTAGGVFCNLEHVASPTPALHRSFFEAMGFDPADEDPSNQLAAVDTQLGWLRESGLDDVDCYWKWRELALLAGVKR